MKSVKVLILCLSKDQGTQERLDHHLTVLRRYLDTSRPDTDYRPQDIREAMANALKEWAWGIVEAGPG